LHLGCQIHLRSGEGLIIGTSLQCISWLHKILIGTVNLWIFRTRTLLPAIVLQSGNISFVTFHYTKFQLHVHCAEKCTCSTDFLAIINLEYECWLSFTWSLYYRMQFNEYICERYVSHCNWTRVESPSYSSVPYLMCCFVKTCTVVSVSRGCLLLLGTWSYLWCYQRSVWERMLTPPRHLILYLVLPEVRVREDAYSF
jgi:hypothetical protein